MMKWMARLLLITSFLFLIPLSINAQEGELTTSTGVQIVNLDSVEPAELLIMFYDLEGRVVHQMRDEIGANKSKTYVQAYMDPLAPVFNGSLVALSNRKIAAIANQNTSNTPEGVPATQGYNGSYTSFSRGSETFYIPIVLNKYYGYRTEISVQNADNSPVDVFVNYNTVGCQDIKRSLPVGASVRFDNQDSCGGKLKMNGSAVITSTGRVVAMVNQINAELNLEQTYNGFSPEDGASELYAPVALHEYYGFNSGFQVQNISDAPMDIIASYSDGHVVTHTEVLPTQSVFFLQGVEVEHGRGWTGSARITSSTGDDIVGIVNQQGPQSGASYNMYTSGSRIWGIPSLLYKYYGFTSAFQVQNVSDSSIDVWVRYDDGTEARSENVEPGTIAPPFIQNDESGHSEKWAGSAVVEATGDIVLIVNQDVLVPGEIDYQYSYNPIPLLGQ